MPHVATGPAAARPDPRGRARRRPRHGSLAALALLIAFGARCAFDGTDPLLLVEERRLPHSEYLVRQLEQGESPARRARAALAMGRIQSPDYTPALVAATRREEGTAERAALFALGQIGLALGAEPAPEAVTACREAARDADPRTVAAAVEALGKLASAGSAPEIAGWLEHSAAEVREAAAHALFRLRFVPPWRRETGDPPPWPPSVVTALATALGDADAAVRRAAAHAFSRFGEAEAVDALVAATADGDEWVRMFAARALGRAGTAEATAALLALCRDESSHVRAETVAALGRLGAAESLPERLDADPSFHVRAAVALALGQAAGPSARGRLGRLLADPSPAVVAAALESVPAVDGARFAARLSHWMEDERWPVRRAAARAAAALGPAARGALEDALDDPDLRVRVAALEAAPDRPEIEERLRASLREPDPALRGTAVTRLARELDEERAAAIRDAYAASRGPEWIEVRESVIDALASDAGSIDLLRRAARDDPASSVRARARLALEARGETAPEAGGREPAPSPFLGARFDEDPVVEIETDAGSLRIRCFAGEAPVHTAVFLALTRQGFYDGGTWHRVVTNFVVQGGDPRGDGWGGSRWLLRDEINARRFEAGTVGMPKAGKDTGSGQLFVTLVPAPHLDGNYTAFGRVLEGQDVLERLEAGAAIRRARVVEP